MKKLLFAVLALAIATPVWAGSITLTDEGSGVVRVDYTMANGEQRVRAFGIDVVFATATPQPTITSISNYKTDGASISTSKGYGIYPSNIVIDGNGLFVSSGTPVSPNSKLPAGTQGGLGTKGVTLEFGSLYAPTTTDANAPLPNTGGTITLCKLTCAANGATSGLLSVTANTARGGIVNENTTAASLTLPSNVSVGFCTATIPGTVTGVGATNNTDCAKVRVTWTAVTGADTYNVYRNTANNTTSANFQQIGSIAASPYDDICTAGTTYYYFVKASNCAGVSVAYSTSATGKRQATSGAPGNNQASDSSYADKVRVTWNAATNTPTSYNVYRATTNNTSGMTSPIGTVTAPTVAYDDTTAVAGTQYYYAVRANNACGIGPFSATEVGRRAAQLTSSPAATATDGTFSDKVRVTWPAVSGLQATGYDVYRNSTNTTVGATKLNTTAITVLLYDDTTSTGTSAAPDWYFIKAKNAFGDSTVFGTSNSGFKYVSGIPTVPTGVVATAGLYVNKVNVSWTASAGATSYTVYRNATNTTVGATNLGSPTGATFDDTTLPATFANYYYFVTATNGSGTSAASTGVTGYGVSSDATCLVAGNTIHGLTITPAMVTTWTNLNKPKCWCCDSQKIGNGEYMTSPNAVNALDLAAIKLAFNKTSTQAGYNPCSDFNLDGTINALDLAIVKLNFNAVVDSTTCK